MLELILDSSEDHGNGTCHDTEQRVLKEKQFLAIPALSSDLARGFRL